jgi:circadian clock protein KaiC
MRSQIKTIIPGFDELVEGGLPKGKCILLSGTPGTGKTIFSLQYIYNGATKCREKGMYISFEENKQNLFSQAKKFGWNMEKFEKEKKIFIKDIPVSDLKENTVKEFITYVKENNITRLVIDSLSALAINIPSTYTKLTEINDLFVKRFIYNFINELRTLKDTTTLLISQTSNDGLSMDGVSEFICDGVILITYESLGGDYSRTLRVRKMREINIDEDIHPLEIGSKGIKIHALD